MRAKQLNNAITIRFIIVSGFQPAFVGYDTTNKRVECSCEVKFTLPLISEIKIDKNKLYKFMDIKKIANFDVLKCYKLIISKVGIIKNFGFYLFVPTFIIINILSLSIL